VLRGAARDRARARIAVEAFLGAGELETKSSAPSYRHDAYSRLLLWLALLERLEGCRGPVVLIDEAENLYRGGTTRVDRRTALRSLAFYCGGMLPRACVVLAITPEALAELREEAPMLLAELAEQRTLLESEDPALFRRRLASTRAIDVPALTPAHRKALAFRVRATHSDVRGEVSDPEWASFVATLLEVDPSPRDVVRRVTDRLERIWWAG
jgi:hypothetical protein